MNVAYNEKNDLLKKLVQIVQANLADEHFGVEQLAREAGFSRTHLNRKLRKLTNKSIGGFIRGIRLQKALEMLEKEEGTVSEIAYKVGFGSPAYFNYCFHEFYGFTPGDARKKFRAENDLNAGDLQPGMTNDKREKVSSGPAVISRIFHYRKIVKPVAGLLILSALSYLFLFRSVEVNHLFKKKSEKSIAVIPFLNESQDSTNQYFIDGITDAITNKLANIKDLTVTSTNSVIRYRNNKTMSTPRIARELGVNYIVEGSGQKIGDQVLVSVQLIEARRDKHILSQQFERKYEDIFNLYTEIALTVAGKIQAVITPEERESINKPPTKNTAAMRMYIRGDEYNGLKFFNQNQRMEYIRQAESFYRKAIRLDSTYSDAWVQLGEISLNKGKPDSALILVKKALQFDHKNPKAYLLSGLAFCTERNAEGMKESLKMALKYDPDNPWAIHWLGGFYYYRGEFSKAFEALLKTRRLMGNLEPGFSNTELYKLELNTLRLARCLFTLGFYEEGKEFAKQWYDLSEDDKWGYNYNLMWAGIINCRFEETYRYGLDTPSENLCLFYMATDLLFLKKYREAVGYFLKQIEQDKKNGVEQPDMFSLLGFAYLKSGQEKEAEKYFELSEKSVKNRLSAHPEYSRPEQVYATTDRYSKFSWFILTSIYAARGQKGKALEYLRQLRINYLASDLQVVMLLKHFPMFDNIRNDPAFKDYLKEAEKHYLAEHIKVEEILRKEGILKE